VYNHFANEVTWRCLNT